MFRQRPKKCVCKAQMFVCRQNGRRWIGGFGPGALNGGEGIHFEHNFVFTGIRPGQNIENIETSFIYRPKEISFWHNFKRYCLQRTISIFFASKVFFSFSFPFLCSNFYSILIYSLLFLQNPKNLKTFQIKFLSVSLYHPLHYCSFSQ